MSELRIWSRDEIAAETERTAVIASLTKREVDVLRAVAKGYSYADIAAEMHVSESTVKGDIQALLRKMRARKVTQTVALAYEYGVLQAGDGRREVPGG